MNDEIYIDIHKEMEATGQTFSQVVVSRLRKLKEFEMRGIEGV